MTLQGMTLDGMSLSGPILLPKRGVPQHLVVLLHGYGSDGDNLIGLGQEWQPLLPQAVFVAPHGPAPCAEFSVGREWFTLRDRTPARVLAGARQAAPVLNTFVEVCLNRWSLSPASLAFVGFSQGSMMALYMGLHCSKKCAGIVGYSGAYMEDSLAPLPAQKPQVMLIHGDADEVVDVARLGEAEERLKALGVPLETHRRPGLRHEIDREGLRLGGTFLQKILHRQEELGTLQP